MTVSFPLAVPSAQRLALHRLASSSGPVPHRGAAVAGLAPAASSGRAVIRWADREGFTVTHTSPWVVQVSGPADRLGDALGTAVAAAHGEKAHATGPLRVPPALRGLVMTPVGLDERPDYRARATFGGGALHEILALPGRGPSAGAGVAVGTVNLSGWRRADLDDYARAYSLGTPTVVSKVVGAGHVATSPQDDAGGPVEVSLDAQVVLASAPKATQRMYFGSPTHEDVLLVLDAMATDAEAGLLQTASTSWGACEDSVPDAALDAQAAAIDRIVAAGATFFAASGDSGSYACSTPDQPDNVPDVDWPASYPLTVAVGGTTSILHLPAYTFQHSAWGGVAKSAPSSTTYAGDGSGGGVSDVWAAPPWQSSDPNQGRLVPDMAAPANPMWSSFFVYTAATGWIQVGGTSAASPAAAAGLANYLATTTHTGLGAIQPLMYQHPEAFLDVSGGTNGEYDATTGFDLVTGWGIPQWNALGAALQGVVAAPLATTREEPFVAVPRYALGHDLMIVLSHNMGGYQSWSLWQGAVDGCTTAVPPDVVTGPAYETAVGNAVKAGTADGPVDVTVASTDDKGVCHSTTQTVFLDGQVPVPTLKATYIGTTSPRWQLTWTFGDPAPSSGLDHYDLYYNAGMGGATNALGLTTTTRTVSGAPGRTYGITVYAYDHAGSRGERTVVVHAPYDDAKATLSTHVSGSRRVSDWTRAGASPDYMGSHVYSSRAGATFAMTFTGRTLTAGMIKSRYAGYADVYVDGTRKGRINLYAASTSYRQAIRLATFTTGGKHTVVVRVVGAHDSRALASNVFLDSLTTT